MAVAPIAATGCSCLRGAHQHNPQEAFWTSALSEAKGEDEFILVKNKIFIRRSQLEAFRAGPGIAKLALHRELHVKWSGLF